MTIEKWNNFEIGEYKAEDFEAIAELFRDVYVKTYPHFDARFLKAERFRTILREYTLPNSQVLTAKAGGEIISFVALGQNFVDQLYVRESFQNKGLGGFWINRAKTFYPDFLELYTFASNEKAIIFYEKHGFKITERGIAPDEKMPDVKMRWESLPPNGKKIFF